MNNFTESDFMQRLSLNVSPSVFNLLHVELAYLSMVNRHHESRFNQHNTHQCLLLDKHAHVFRILHPLKISKLSTNNVMLWCQTSQKWSISSKYLLHRHQQPNRLKQARKITAVLLKWMVLKPFFFSSFLLVVAYVLLCVRCMRL